MLYFLIGTIRWQRKARDGGEVYSKSEEGRRRAKEKGDKSTVKKARYSEPLGRAIVAAFASPTGVPGAAKPYEHAAPFERHSDSGAATRTGLVLMHQEQLDRQGKLTRRPESAVLLRRKPCPPS
jgi:hypothetical protein